DVIVDTFTVEEPTKFYAYSREDDITLDIENYKIEPINNDLYVSPDGNNSNSGLTPSEPLLNIYDALIKIKSDSTHPNTIHVAEGTYSPSATGEFFALGGKEYISIIGAGKEETILDAEQSTRLLRFCNNSESKIKNLTLKNGYSKYNGGIFIENSDPLIKNVKLFNNDCFKEYGYVHVGGVGSSNAIFEDVIMTDSVDYVTAKAVKFGNINYPLFLNCSINSNHSNPVTGYVGAMTLDLSVPLLINCKITDNYGIITSGISSIWSEDTIYVINSTIADNDSCSQGAIRLADNSHIHLINTILRNESDTEIYFYPTGEENSATLEYCNVDGGIDAIDVNNNGTLNWGEGNIDQDPLFVGGDPFSYQLSAGSPCIDAGTPDTTGLNLPATDLAGNPRIYNGRVDIGAYEYKPEAVGGDPDTSFVNQLYLFQNQPNPFKNSTEILFITSDYERVENYTLSIYNTIGQLVRRYEGRANNFSFKTKVKWDSKDSRGREVAPGTYFYKLEYNNNAVVRKMVKVK
ncbi:MAG: T9SS type A sorting domain-containing protein, partial [Candidatus Cloacimonetes bacterium]|nr:T9SS type A sorting domain-containing protein [Candidatus Cloacimonadota bacterium]